MRGRCASPVSIRQHAPRRTESDLGRRPAFPGEVWENQQKLTIGDGWIGTGFNLSDTDTYTVYVTALCSANVSVTGAGLTAQSEAQKATFADAAEARLDGE